MIMSPSVKKQLNSGRNTGFTIDCNKLFMKDRQFGPGRRYQNKYSENAQSLFLDSTCDIEEYKRQRHATLAFIRIDMRHWGPPPPRPQ